MDVRTGNVIGPDEPQEFCANTPAFFSYSVLQLHEFQLISHVGGAIGWGR